MTTLEMKDNATRSGILPASERFPWPTLPVDQGRLAGYLAACEAARIGYRLGAKADSGGRLLAAYPPRYAAIDCSGFARAVLAYASGATLPDGSVVQHEWVAAHHFKTSTYAGLLLRDGALRIAFISPNAVHPVGHVYLCRDGRTLESYGGHGPGSRSPLAHVLHAYTTAVYVLTPPG